MTEDEKKFVVYWEANRNRQQKFFKQLAIGLPIGTLFILPVLLSLISGWHKRAQMEFNMDKSVIVVLLVAMIAIVVFISVFTVKHRWDINEQRYKELKLEKKEE